MSIFLEIFQQPSLAGRAEKDFLAALLLAGLTGIMISLAIVPASGAETFALLLSE